MVLEINQLRVAPQDAGAFELAMAAAKRLLLNVPGCMSVELLRQIEHPGRYQIRVGWERLEVHLEVYPDTEEAAQVRALLAPLIVRADRGHYEAAPLERAEASPDS